MTNTVEHYYDRQAEREWQRLERHRTEFAVTRRVLQDYLPPPPAAILDVGGGPGREINKLDGEAWQAWVNLNYQLGRDPSIHGAAEHLLYVGKL